MDLTLLHELVDRCIDTLPPAPGKSERSFAIMVHAQSEAQATALSADLSHQGFIDVRVEAKRGWFRKKWELIGTTALIPYSAPALHKWADATFAIVTKHGCSLEGWSPLALSNEEL